MSQDEKISRVDLASFDASLGLNRGVSKFKEIIWYFIKIIFFMTAFPFPSKFKVILLKLFGADMGYGIVIKPRVNIHFPWKLKVGNNVWIGEEVFLLNFELLTIGNNVCISQRAFLCGGNHNYEDPSMSYRNGVITLEDGCWVGANVFIAPSVVIGMDSVVSAGSVVTQSLPKNGVFKGNPVQLIKKRW